MKLISRNILGAYNLTVPNKLTRHSSTSKLEEIHTDHIKIVGELENEEEQTGVVKNENCNIAANSSSSSLASTQNQERAATNNFRRALKAFKGSTIVGKRLGQNLIKLEHFSFSKHQCMDRVW